LIEINRTHKPLRAVAALMAIERRHDPATPVKVRRSVYRQMPLKAESSK
jgi:hypothetical protein